MSEPRSFTVRPFSKQPRNDHKDAFRVHLSPSSLTFLRLRAGDLCSLQLAEGPPKTAIAWNALENIQNTVVQTSKTLQDCYGIKLGDKVSIAKVDGPIEEVETARLEECTDPTRLTSYGVLSETDRGHWEWCLEYSLSKCEIVSTGLIFEVELKGHRRSFRVAEIWGQNPNSTNTIFRFTENSKVKIGEGKEAADRVAPIELRLSGLGGMSRQVERINEALADFNSKTERLIMPSFYEHSRGMIIYGPKGTGKTALLQQLETAGWKRSFRIGTSTMSRNVGEGESKLRKVFSEALRSQPSLVIIDQVEFIAPRRTSHDSMSLASVLCESLDSIKNAHVLVVAATRHPNDVDDALRTPHRLAIEIELPVPTAKDRAEILRAIRGSSTEPSDSLLEMIAEKTHGYVGADLFALLQVACRKARNRQLLEHGFSDSFRSSSVSALQRETPVGEDTVMPLKICEADVLFALQEIRPTAMREVLLETPKVRWSDIGGHHEIKRRLQKAVQRPLKVRRPNSKTRGKIYLTVPVSRTNEKAQRQ